MNTERVYKNNISPLEAQEQKALFAWAELSMGKYPELRWLFHITNEGKRTKSHGADLVRQGLKKGVPDICLPVPKGNYHGLYIEMKRVGEKTTEQQDEWLQGLTKNGYCCYVADKGWEDASKAITWYLNLKGEKDEI